jgi:DNA-binding MarR family transcriptional regulator
MTNRLDRLQRRGLVLRRPDPDDGRGIRVRLTPRGQGLVDAAVTDLLAREEALLAALPDRDRDRLARLLRAVLLHFEGSADAG